MGMWLAQLEYYTNPLHIYCRMIDAGLPKEFSSNLCRVYERGVFKPYLN